jgi:preprotein translocase subunit SecD
MLNQMVRFNLYLWVVAGCFLGSALGSLAADSHSATNAKPAKFKKLKGPVVMKFHMEARADVTGRSSTASIGRSTPFAVTIEKEAFLSEQYITEAVVVPDTLGGFQLRIRCSQKGRWLLEQYSTEKKGRRIAVFCAFEKEARWLAAPLVEKPVTDGILAFTPDTTREEADQLAEALTRQGKDILKWDL